MELNFKNLEFIDENIDFEYIKKILVKNLLVILINVILMLIILIQ